MAVDAEWAGLQICLYRLSALELFDALYDIEIIRMTIYQPRLESRQHMGGFRQGRPDAEWCGDELSRAVASRVRARV